MTGLLFISFTIMLCFFLLSNFFSICEMVYYWKERKNEKSRESPHKFEKDPLFSWGDIVILTLFFLES